MHKWKIWLLTATVVLFGALGVQPLVSSILQPIPVYAAPSASTPAFLYSRLATATMTTSALPTTRITPTLMVSPSNDGAYWQYWWVGTTAADGTASTMSSTYLTGYPHLIYTSAASSTLAPTDNWDVVVRNVIRIPSGATVPHLGVADTTYVLSPDILGGDGLNRDTLNAEYNLITSATVLPIPTAPAFFVTNGGDSKQFVVVLYVFTPGNQDVDGDA